MSEIVLIAGSFTIGFFACAALMGLTRGNDVAAICDERDRQWKIALLESAEERVRELDSMNRARDIADEWGKHDIKWGNETPKEGNS